MSFSLFQAIGAIAASIVPPMKPARPLEIDLDLPEPLSPAERAVVGLWVTEDGAVRLDLRRGGRYGKLRDTAPHAFSGRYEIDRSRLYFEDDTGLVARGELRRGDLHLGGRRYQKA